MSAAASALRRGACAVADAVRSGEVLAVDVVEACLAALARDAAGATPLGDFLTLQAESARSAASEVDRRRARGEALGPLAGVPMGIKDALHVVGAPTTAGSRVLLRGGDPGVGPEAGYRPPFDATVVARLRRADAVLVGKCNMDEFAMGSSTENSGFFPARNPWDRARTPGGSSGGSAASVAAGHVAASLGSDTGGSIRQPAGLTGTVGVKPTYGRVSRYGLVAFASSLDQVGPIATDVRSAARVLEVIAGRDEHDATSLDGAVPELERACEAGVAGLRVGVPEEYFGEGLAPEVAAQVREALAVLEGLGARLVPVHLPHTRYALSTYYVLATAEASSNLARFDGVRYGLRVPEAAPAGGAGAKELAAFYARTRSAGFGAEVKRRIVLGTYVLSAGYYETHYLRAQKARTLIRRDFEAAFSHVDLVAGPVSPTVAFPLGERTRDPLAMYLADVFTLPASLAGLPALSVPTRPATQGGGRALPVGLQLVAPPLEEARLFAAASAYEAARGPNPSPPSEP